MKITILSRLQVEQILPFKGAALISITCPNSDFPQIIPGWEAVLQLQFDDIKDPELAIHGYKLFSKEQATQVLDFVFTNKPHYLFINCDAGISRSAGVAVAIHEIVNGGYIGNQHRYSLHNRYVTSTILNRWHDIHQADRCIMLHKLRREHGT
jgi:predicted protein tyrosine phosphatase